MAPCPSGVLLWTWVFVGCRFCFSSPYFSAPRYPRLISCTSCPGPKISHFSDPFYWRVGLEIKIWALGVRSVFNILFLFIDYPTPTLSVSSTNSRSSSAFPPIVPRVRNSVRTLKCLFNASQKRTLCNREKVFCVVSMEQQAFKKEPSFPDLILPSMGFLTVFLDLI